MENSGNPHLDLTGKLIIKVALGDDIRRIPIHNEDITYDELVLMMQRVYRGKLSTNDEITIKYKDEDGDLITIFDSSDLSFAIQCSRILKITLFVGGAISSLAQADAVAVRRELQEVRDKVINLLDRLEPSPLVAATQGLSLTDGIPGRSDISRASPLPVSNGMKVSGKEFDPLKSQLSNESAQNKVMASFGGGEVNASPSVSQSYDRAATPDSISSIGSSASNKVKAQQSTPQPLSSDTQSQAAQPGVQQPPQAPPSSQQQPSPAYPNQPGYGMTHPGQMPQATYTGQPGYSTAPPVPGQPSQTPQPGQHQTHPPTSSSQQQYQPQQSPHQGYDPSGYGNYNNPGYQNAVGQPGTAQPQMMYGAGMPNPYGQAPGMPQMPQQPKAPGYGAQAPPQVGQSPGNPYSRGAPSYSAGYPRPSAGYPQ